MPACIRIEAEALKLRIKVVELRRLVNAGHKLSLTQIAQILARQAPPYRLDDVRWI